MHIFKNGVLITNINGSGNNLAFTGNFDGGQDKEPVVVVHLVVPWY
jgi:hypothetical protein